MPNENSPADVLAMQVGGDHALRRELEELRAKLAQYEPSNVVEGTDFGGEIPRYRLNEPGFYGQGLDVSYYGVGAEFDYDATPNDTMVPVNEAARKRMTEYLEWQADCQRRKAQSQGREWGGVLITDKGVMVADTEQEARRSGSMQVVMPVDKQPVPPMLNMQAKRGPGRPRKIVGNVKLPDEPGRPQPESLGFRHREAG